MRLYYFCNKSRANEVLLLLNGVLDKPPSRIAKRVKRVPIAGSLTPKYTKAGSPKISNALIIYPLLNFFRLQCHFLGLLLRPRNSIHPTYTNIYGFPLQMALGKLPVVPSELPLGDLGPRGSFQVPAWRGETGTYQKPRKKVSRKIIPPYSRLIAGLSQWGTEGESAWRLSISSDIPRGAGNLPSA